MENEILDYVMETPGNTNPAILNQMLDEASGTKLPEPTIADNGKVLGVADGAYALVSGGGGGGAEPLIVNYVMHEAESEEDVSYPTGIDVSYNEIKSAVLSGKCVILNVASNSSLDTSEAYQLLTDIGISSLNRYLVHFGYNEFAADSADVDMSVSQGQ